MARSTMAALILRTRTLIGDTPTPQTFTDDQVEDALDHRRTDVIECQLSFRGSTAPGGTITYHDYYAPRGDWEDTVVLKDRTWATITADVADLVSGHWTFTANTIGPVFITGAVYDLAGAAYDLLTAWSSLLSLDFDFATDGQSFSRSQKFAQLSTLSNEYARRMRPRAARTDWRSVVGAW